MASVTASPVKIPSDDLNRNAVDCLTRQNFLFGERFEWARLGKRTSCHGNPFSANATAQNLYCCETSGSLRVVCPRCLAGFQGQFWENIAKAALIHGDDYVFFRRCVTYNRMCLLGPL